MPVTKNAALGAPRNNSSNVLVHVIPLCKMIATKKQGLVRVCVLSSLMVIFGLLLMLEVTQGADSGDSVKQAQENVEAILKQKEEIDPDIKDILGGDDGEHSSSVAADEKSTSSVAPQLDLMDHGDEGKDEANEEKEGGGGEPKAHNASAPDSAEAVFLPEEGSAEKEHSNSLAIFFVLSVLILCIFTVHAILRLKCHYLPESLVIVFLGAFIGLFMRLLPTEDMKSVESFSPTMFFLVLLPPIIFESGYNLHKGNFKRHYPLYYRISYLCTDVEKPLCTQFYRG